MQSQPGAAREPRFPRPPTAADATADYLLVARVLGPQALQGELRCELVTDFPDRFEPGSTVFAGDPPTRITVQSARVMGRNVYLKLEGIDDRDAADALRGAELLVPASEAVELPPGEFLWRDVIGLRVEDPEGRIHGHVTDILRSGANDVYVAQGEQGEILIPAVKSVVTRIAPEEGRIVIKLLPGLLPDGNRRQRSRPPSDGRRRARARRP